MKKFVISKDQLAALIPQASMLNARIEELQDAVCTIDDIVDLDRASVTGFGDSASDNSRLRLKIKSAKATKPFLIGVSQFLKLPVDAGDDKTIEFSAWLAESNPNGNNYEFPEKFTIKSVKDREKNGRKVFPAYMYKAMEEKQAVKKREYQLMNSKPTDRNGKVIQENDWVNQEIYRDFTFIEGLPTGELQERFAGKAECLKDIVIIPASN